VVSFSLPEEFQAEHGSIDLTDDKPDVNGNKDDDGEDEDLDLGRAGQRVWLCKVRLTLSTSLPGGARRTGGGSSQNEREGDEGEGEDREGRGRPESKEDAG
jgi:hypothetical protein